jgi:hypothetical protein
MCYYDKLYCHDVKIRDNKMKWQCLTQGKCVRIGIYTFEGHELLLTAGRNKKKYNFSLKEN